MEKHLDLEKSVIASVLRSFELGKYSVNATTSSVGKQLDLKSKEVSNKTYSCYQGLVKLIKITFLVVKDLVANSLVENNLIMFDCRSK